MMSTPFLHLTCSKRNSSRVAWGCPGVSGGARRNGGKDFETEPRVMARITAVKQTLSNDYATHLLSIRTDNLISSKWKDLLH